MIKNRKDEKELILSELISCLSDYKIIGSNDPTISGIHYNSSVIGFGEIFVCITGSRFDGYDFAIEAVKKGAVCIISAKPVDGINVPQIIVRDTRAAMGMMAAKFYGNPSEKLKMIGITGTNGKTTTNLLVASIMRSSGLKTGIIGTLGIYNNGNKVYEGRTTPESAEIQKYLSQMVSNGTNICVSEVSSHAIDQGRYIGTKYDVLVFTNLTQDHLDYHGDMQLYKAAKSKLFHDHQAHKERLAIVYNADDPNAKEIVGMECSKLISYGLDSKYAVSAKIVDTQLTGSVFEVKNSITKNKFNVTLKLPGLFNIYNALAATSAASVLEISDDYIVHGIESVKHVPGRTEIISGNDFSVIIDYAHTPDGLEQLLKSLKACTKGRMITVFGCGGDRDKTKRALMGMIASRYSDFSVVTSDNPRSEDPLDIANQITEKMSGNYIVELDRKTAIEKAISSAAKNDCVVVAGKGHETYQEINKEFGYFNDSEAVKEVLAGK